MMYDLMMRPWMVGLGEVADSNLLDSNPQRTEFNEERIKHQTQQQHTQQNNTTSQQHPQHNNTTSIKNIASTYQHNSTTSTHTQHQHIPTQPPSNWRHLPVGQMKPYTTSKNNVVFFIHFLPFQFWQKFSHSLSLIVRRCWFGAERRCWCMWQCARLWTLERAKLQKSNPTLRNRCTQSVCAFNMCMVVYRMCVCISLVCVFVGVLLYEY